MTVTVRVLNAKDRDAWRPLWQGYLEYYKTELPDDVTDLSWQRLMDEDFGLHGLGAFDEKGTLLGIVHYMFHPVTWSKTDRCYLEDLFTHPDARGQGVGRALIEAVAARAKKAGAEQIYWLTENFNETAQALYDKVAEKTPFIKYAKSL